MVVWWKKKVNGSVLLLALVISLLVVCLLLFLFPLNSFMFKLYGQFSHNRMVYSKINGALSIYLSNPKTNPVSNQELSPLLGSTTVVTERWGLFELVTIKSQHETFEKQKIFIVGQSFFDATDSLVLYQSRINSPLSCVGSATIEGRMRIPIQGLKPAYMEGSYHTGNLSLAKVVGQSDISLPLPGSLFFDNLSRVTNPESIAKFYSIVPKPAAAIPDSVTVSYSEKPVVYFAHENLTLGRTRIDGKVYICSNQSVTIEPYSSLRGIIVVAPRVIIKKGVVGSFQVFATDSLAIESNVTLEYPSVVVLSQQKTDKLSTLSVGVDSFIDGAVVTTRPNGIPSYFYPRTEIDKSARVRGLVYSQGLLDARGTIVGSIYTEHFYCQSPSGFYLNYLNSGQLLFFDMPYEYSIPFIFDNKWKKCVVKRVS